jgi:hypothetical protein
MTTPAERLRAQAAEVLALAEELDGGPPAPSEYVDTTFACRVLGKGSSTLYRWAREGNVGLIGQKVFPGGFWRFKRSSVEALARSLRRPANVTTE